MSERNIPSKPAGIWRPITSEELAVLIRGYRDMGATRSIKDGNTLAALLELQERRAVETSVAVAGDTLPTTLAQFELRASRLLEDEQAKIAPDNALVAFLCDAVRLARENERLAKRPLETNGVMPAEADVLAWAVRSFGPIAQNVDERAARVAEEAIEIAQVEGVPLETIKRIADRVYSRPAGERWQEIGGTMIGLLSYAAIVGLTLSDCARREFDRVLSKPRDWWAKKHAEKVAAGTADLSPVKASAPTTEKP